MEMKPPSGKKLAPFQVLGIIFMHIGLPLEGDTAVRIDFLIEKGADQPINPLQEVGDVEKEKEHLDHLRRWIRS